MPRPSLLHTVLDALEVRREAEFWRQLLELAYRPGDEGPDGGEDPDWLVLTRGDGTRTLAFQRVDELARTTWPSQQVPMQLHLDLTVEDLDELAAQRDRALALGASLLLDRADDEAEPLYVLADPEGHPFCIFVSPAPPVVAAFDLPAGERSGTCAFRLMPTDDLVGAPSRLTAAPAAGRSALLSYTWQHPEDGEQSGTLLLGWPAADGSVTAAWVDSWHQVAVGLLTGSQGPDGVEVGYEYAPGWRWIVVLRRNGDGLSMVMRNVVPEGHGGPAGAYDVMRATWS